MLHLRAANGIRSLNNIALKTTVIQQYNIRHEGLEEEAFYLLESSEDELMEDPV